MRLNRRFFTLLAVLMLCMSFLTITASAEANPPKDDVIIYTADPTEPQPTEAAPKPTTPKPTTPPETQPPAATAPTTPTTVTPVEPFTEGNAIAKTFQFLVLLCGKTPLTAPNCLIEHVIRHAAAKLDDFRRRKAYSLIQRPLHQTRSNLLIEEFIGDFNNLCG